MLAYDLIHVLGLPARRTTEPGCYLNATGVNELEAKNDGNMVETPQTPEPLKSAFGKRIVEISALLPPGGSQKSRCRSESFSF